MAYEKPTVGRIYGTGEFPPGNTAVELGGRRRVSA